MPMMAGDRRGEEPRRTVDVRRRPRALSSPESRGKIGSRSRSLVKVQASPRRRAGRRAGATEVVARLVAGAAAWRGARAQENDLTLVALRVTPTDTEPAATGATSDIRPVPPPGRGQHQ
jgi:hypothetical protein